MKAQWPEAACTCDRSPAAAALDCRSLVSATPPTTSAPLIGVEIGAGVVEGPCG